MPLHHLYGIDLGSDTVKIYNHRNDSIHIEKDMIAIRDGDSVLAIGNEAYEVLGKTPENIQVITPMSNGRISDVLLMEAVLHTLLERCDRSLGYAPTLFFSVPTDMTEIDRRAYYSIAHRGSLRRGKVYLVEKPVVDALSFGIPVSRTSGSMIVNFGAESTEISVIADSRVVISRMLPVGGQSINEAIAVAVRRHNAVHISSKMAQRLKFSLTDLNQVRMEGRKITGTNMRTGLPGNTVVTAQTVTAAVSTEVERIVAEIRRFLERIPPQIRDSVREEGVYICGGSTRIPGLMRYLLQNLDCPVRLSGYYELSSIYGLKELIGHPELRHWATPVHNKLY